MLGPNLVRPWQPEQRPKTALQQRIAALKQPQNTTLKHRALKHTARTLSKDRTTAHSQTTALKQNPKTQPHSLNTVQAKRCSTLVYCTPPHPTPRVHRVSHPIPLALRPITLSKCTIYPSTLALYPRTKEPSYFFALVVRFWHRQNVRPFDKLVQTPNSPHISPRKRSYTKWITHSTVAKVTTVNGCH